MKHTGSGLGTAPTQKTLATTGMTMVRVANGRLVAGWQNWDMLGLMQQIKQEPMAPTYLAAKVGKAV
jgi:predicted ester cyclase